MTNPQPPTLEALAETLAALSVQVASLRGSTALTEQQLAVRIEVLAETLAEALDAAAPRGPAAPYWADIDRETYDRQLAELVEWVENVLLKEYLPSSGLRACWRNHRQVIWEMSTLATEWRRTYGGRRPDLARALELYDRWLPNTLRRIDEITKNCVTECVMLRRRDGSFLFGAG